MDIRAILVGGLVGFATNYVTMIITERRAKMKQREIYKPLEGEYKGYVYDSSDYSIDRQRPVSKAKIDYVRDNLLAITLVENGAQNKWSGEICMSGRESGSVTWWYTMWNGQRARETDISGTKHCRVSVQESRVQIQLMDDKAPDFGKELLERLL